MKRKNLKIIFGLMIMAIIFFVLPTQAKAAGKCNTLSKGKTYNYNLDGKGASEKIKYGVSPGSKLSDGRRNYTVKVFVNSKTVYNKTFKSYDSNPVRIIVSDVNTSDKKMELLILEGESLFDSWTSQINHIRYYTYASGKTTYVQDLVSLFKSGYSSKVDGIHGLSDSSGKYFSVNGKGGLTAKVCLKFAEDDYKHLQRTVTLKNGKFTIKTIADSNFSDLDCNNYKMKKDLKAYTTAGGKKAAFTMKKGKKVLVTGVYRTSKGALYFKVKYNGKYGYVSPSTLIKSAAAQECLHI